MQQDNIISLQQKRKSPKSAWLVSGSSLNLGTTLDKALQMFLLVSP